MKLSQSALLLCGSNFQTYCTTCTERFSFSVYQYVHTVKDRIIILTSTTIQLTFTTTSVTTHRIFLLCQLLFSYGRLLLCVNEKSSASVRHQQIVLKLAARQHCFTLKFYFSESQISIISQLTPTVKRMPELLLKRTTCSIICKGKALNCI